jgi:DNA polymerase
MIAALAGEQPVLDVFASGQDVYCHAASGIFDRTITKADDRERQVGKVSVLSLGFQGGPIAFAAMAKNYALDIASAYEPVMATATGEQVERANFGWRRYVGPMSHEAYLTADIIKQAWRENNPSIVQYWRDCEDAVLEAVETRRPAHVGAITYQVVPIAGRDYLWARLPTGRLLCYTDPELRTAPTAWGARRLSVAASSIDSRTKQWTRRQLYGGLLAENNTQAAARDVLVAGMFRLRDAGYRIAAHVHDEAIVCIRKGAGDAEQIRQLMIQRDPWIEALGLPVDADVSPALNRYRK